MDISLIKKKRMKRGWMKGFIPDFYQCYWDQCMNLVRTISFSTYYLNINIKQAVYYSNLKTEDVLRSPHTLNEWVECEECPTDRKKYELAHDPLKIFIYDNLCRQEISMFLISTEMSDVSLYISMLQ